MPLEIKQNEPLSKHTTFAIGGPAKYFAVAKTKEEVLEAIGFAEGKKLPFFVLGGGSNILINDGGYDGLIIKIQIGGIKVNEDEITAGAGVLLSHLVNESANKGLSGLEWAVGIPGTIGGAVNGNAGAYGRSVSESLNEIIVLAEEGEDGGKWKEKRYSNKDCGFEYRKSKFKHLANREIILEVVLNLQKSDTEKVRGEIRNTILQRKGKIPAQPSAGCVFKNIKKDGHLVATVGNLVEECGLKGVKSGNAEIPHLHGNYVVNFGGAKAEDVLKLINLCKQKVKDRFNLELEEEIVVM